MNEDSENRKEELERTQNESKSLEEMLPDTGSPSSKLEYLKERLSEGYEWVGLTLSSKLEYLKEKLRDPECTNDELRSSDCLKIAHELDLRYHRGRQLRTEKEVRLIYSVAKARISKRSNPLKFLDGYSQLGFLYSRLNEGETFMLEVDYVEELLMDPKSEYTKDVSDIQPRK